MNFFLLMPNSNLVEKTKSSESCDQIRQDSNFMGRPQSVAFFWLVGL